MLFILYNNQDVTMIIEDHVHHQIRENCTEGSSDDDQSISQQMINCDDFVTCGRTTKIIHEYLYRLAHQ